MNKYQRKKAKQKKYETRFKLMTVNAANSYIKKHKDFGKTLEEAAKNIGEYLVYCFSRIGQGAADIIKKINSITPKYEVTEEDLKRINFLQFDTFEEIEKYFEKNFKRKSQNTKNNDFPSKNNN